MQSEWYQSFFTPLALDFWRAAVPAAATAEEVSFLVQNLAVSPPSRLLDVPSGFGRHALALASRGYHVTGIDIAESAVRAAQQEAQAQGLTTANFVVADMRIPPPDGPYDGAYCFGNSFGYLSHEDMNLFIRNVFHAARPGARWIIDTGVAAESLLPQLVDERKLEAGGITYSVRNGYDAVAGRLVQSCTLERGTQRQLAEISYGIYTVAELHRLLQGEGWRTVGAYGSLDGRPFQLRDRRLLLVAQRP
jgi:SAM-dependent methyltransferase